MPDRPLRTGMVGMLAWQCNKRLTVLLDPSIAPPTAPPCCIPLCHGIAVSDYQHSARLARRAGRKVSPTERASCQISSRNPQTGPPQDIGG